jgi:transcriptional regulator with XRE-family HTH domain
MMLGKTIRMLRVARDLSQGKLAREIRVSPGYLSLVEKEKREPSLGLLKRLASYFDIPVGFLLLERSDTRTFNADQRRIMNEIRRSLTDYIISRDSIDRGRRIAGPKQ